MITKIVFSHKINETVEISPLYRDFVGGMKLDDFRRYDVWMCGTMNKDTEHQMRCDGCHDHVSSCSSFCRNCGKRLDYETLAVRSYFSQGYT